MSLFTCTTIVSRLIIIFTWLPLWQTNNITQYHLIILTFREFRLVMEKFQSLSMPQWVQSLINQCSLEFHLCSVCMRLWFTAKDYLQKYKCQIQNKHLRFNEMSRSAQHSCDLSTIWLHNIWLWYQMLCLIYVLIVKDDFLMILSFYWYFTLCEKNCMICSSLSASDRENIVFPQWLP